MFGYILPLPIHKRKALNDFFHFDIWWAVTYLIFESVGNQVADFPITC